MHALLPWLFLAAWPMLTAAVLHRRRALALAAAALAAGHVAWLLPLLEPGPAAGAPPDGRPVRVLTVNLYALNRRIHDVALTIRSADADVLFLQELTPPHHEDLADAGVLDRYAHGFADPRKTSTGSAIYSKLPLEEAGVWWAEAQPMTRATLRLGPAHSVRLYNVHTTSPVSDVRSWNGELEAVARAVARENDPVVLAGDFNATRDHRGVRRLLDLGWRDAHDAVGRAAATTWPAGRRRVPPLVRLDRILLPDGVHAARVVELRAIGSDHKPVLADLVVAPGRK